MGVDDIIELVLEGEDPEDVIEAELRLESDWVVMAHTRGGFRGDMSSPVKKDDGAVWRGTEDEARKEADRLNKSVSTMHLGPAMIHYTPERS